MELQHSGILLLNIKKGKSVSKVKVSKRKEIEIVGNDEDRTFIEDEN